MKEYQDKVLRTHLEKDPDKYVIPTTKKCDAEFSSLKPAVKSVSVYKYPNEHSVVLEGKNLWFCHEIQLGEGKNVLPIKSSAQNITGRSIQFNFRPTEVSERLVGNDGKMQVILHSHFAQQIQKRIKVKQVGLAN